jgi:HAMP domain-containing protein
MIHVLSQLDKLPDNYLVWWLIAFGGLALIIQTVMNVADRFKTKGPSGIHPLPLPTTEVEKLATRAEVQAMCQRIETDVDELRKAISEERATARDALGKVHSRIDLVAKNTDEIRGVVGQINQTTQLLLTQAMSEHHTK